jgi:hypothetical protein
VTEQEAVDCMRIGEAFPDLALMVEAASSLVLNYMGVNGEFLQDSAGDVPQDSSGPSVTVPSEVKQATLLTIRDLYEGGTFTNGELTGAARALLFKYYKPTLA